MSAVRAQRAEHLNRLSTVDEGAGEITADAILKRFDVTPKPGMSNERLGAIAYGIVAGRYGPDLLEEIGLRMFAVLYDQGFKIVKADDQ